MRLVAQNNTGRPSGARSSPPFVPNSRGRRRRAARASRRDRWAPGTASAALSLARSLSRCHDPRPLRIPERAVPSSLAAGRALGRLTFHLLHGRGVVAGEGGPVVAAVLGRGAGHEGAVGGGGHLGHARHHGHIGGPLLGHAVRVGHAARVALRLHGGPGARCGPSEPRDAAHSAAQEVRVAEWCPKCLWPRVTARGTDRRQVPRAKNKCPGLAERAWLRAE